MAAALLGLALAGPAIAAPAVITGTVLGPGLRPLAGASIAVVGAGCETVSGADGTFTLRCEATGPKRVRAFAGGGPANEQEVELGPDRMIHLNLLLAPPVVAAPAVPVDGSVLGNPVVTSVGGHPLTLRALGVVMAVAGFVLGFLAMLVVGRGLGLAVEKRRLDAGEVGELVLNAGKLRSERLYPVAVVGAAGRSWSLSYGVDELAAAFAARRHAWIAASLVPPILVAAAVVGFALALMVGQPLYLFVAMMVVPLGFVVTPVMIIVQARKRAG